MAVIKQSSNVNTNPNPYNVSNPHPGLGVDPNIINEFGHTKYPKYVDHPTEKEVVQIIQSMGKDQFITHKVKNDHPKRILVQNEAEEKALLGGIEKAKPKSWDKGLS